MSPKKEIKFLLEDMLGSESVSSEEEILEKYSKDQSFVHPRKPEVVAFPKTTEEIQEILRYASSEKIPVIFLPLLGFISLDCILVFLLFFKVKYTFFAFLFIALSVSFLIVIVRLLFNKHCYKNLSIRQFKGNKDFYYSAIIFLIGLFIITGHLGHLDIPRSFDHMSYSTLASLLKIEGTYPRFNIYAFPSMVHTGVPSGWIVMVSFISRLLDFSVPRTQLTLVMLFFPFLGIGVYYISRMVFKGDGLINNKLLEHFRVSIDFTTMQITFE